MYIKKGEYRKIEIYSSLKIIMKTTLNVQFINTKIGLNSFSAINHTKIRFHTLLNNVWKKTDALEMDFLSSFLWREKESMKIT